MTHYSDGGVTLHHGDCLDILRELPDDSVDSVVTDPPYGLEFMGREWDGADGFRRSLNNADVSRDNAFGRTSRTSPEYRAGSLFQEWCEAWATECLRVLKPGGHLLAFGGTRTSHRLACAVEDAGFEIRDSIAWLYGSGFPKSLDVSKAIDKAGGDPLAFRRFARAYAAAVDASLLKHSDIDRHLAIKASSCYWAREDHRGGMPPRHHWETVRDLLGLGADFEALYDEAEREIVGQRTTGIGTGRGAVAYIADSENRDITAPATDAARTWQGWGTALKPAHEPIVVARKPLTGTVAANVLTHGTGALNVDGCRVEGEHVRTTWNTALGVMNDDGWVPQSAVFESHPAGRWPANVVLDESQAEALDAQSGSTQSRIGAPRGADSGDGWGMTATGAEYDDKGGASRFFYVAKADASERVRVNGTAHPTVKPLALMRWLVRLVTPPGGTVLEPFAGSGATVEACILEGFRCIAIEREADYLPLIVQRVNRRRDPVAAVQHDEDRGLFDLLGEETA